MEFQFIFLRDAAGVIAEPLKHIANLCLTTGQIPGDFKRQELYHCMKR